VQFRRGGLLSVTMLLGLAALAALLGINKLYHTFVMRLAGQEMRSLSESLRDAGLSHAGMILAFCLFPAVLEEIAFRGLVQHWLQAAITPWKALVLASALFTALHFSIVSAPYLFAVGLLLGWLKQRTGSLYPSMVVHFLHNFVVLEFL